MRISIVTTLYRSAPYLQAFYERTHAAVTAITSDYEIIFVNDGSPDNALEVTLKLHRQDEHVQVVDLSRNFGHHKAIMTGLAYATGDYIFLIDCDLEEDPAWLELFYHTLKEHGVDVVFGVQASRNDPGINRLTSGVFYTLYNWLSSVPLPRNLVTVRLMSARYVQALLEHREKVMIIAALWEMAGFKQLSVEVNKKYKGNTSYNLVRKLSNVLRSVTATSNKPLVFIAYLGFFLTITSVLYIAYLLFGYIFLGYGVDGWASVIVSIWFFGGLNIFVMGIVAIYLSVIFTEVKDRPYTIVRHHHVHEREPEQELTP